VHRPVEGAWAAQLSTPQSLVVQHEDLAHVADADERRDAVVEKDLALVPQEIGERVPQPWHDELSRRIDDLRPRRRRLAFPPDAADTIAFDHHLRIAYRFAAAPIDEGASVDDEHSRGGSLGGLNDRGIVRCNGQPHTEQDNRRPQSSHAGSRKGHVSVLRAQAATIRRVMSSSQNPIRTPASRRTAPVAARPPW
jgi:hypothetical protein